SSLATTTESATESPLPLSLAGTSVRVNQGGIERTAPLFSVSPMQINLLLPVGMVEGPATFTVVRSDTTAPSGVTRINRNAPALFSANANGRGVPAGYVLIRSNNLPDELVSIADLDPQTNSFVPRPIDISSSDKRYFLILFGTGFRHIGGLDVVSVKIGGVDAPVIFAGAQRTLAGLDQLNVEIPPSLAGRGEAEVVFTVGDRAANTLLVKIK